MKHLTYMYIAFIIQPEITGVLGQGKITAFMCIMSDIALTRIDQKQILFVTDMPIVLFHGKREWTDRTYINLSNEDFTWNTERRSADEESRYTLFIYEYFRAVLDACDRNGLTDTQKEDLFFRNAKRLLGR